jgi:hypothetical protein
MRFKTPAPLFNVNGDDGARARPLPGVGNFATKHHYEINIQVEYFYLPKEFWLKS